MSCCTTVLLTKRIMKCPSNCHCKYQMAACDILFCDDDLYVDTLLLRVEGRLCPHHYEMLSHYPDVYKELMNSYCSEQLKKCK